MFRIEDVEWVKGFREGFTILEKDVGEIKLAFFDHAIDIGIPPEFGWGVELEEADWAMLKTRHPEEVRARGGEG